MSRSPRPPTTPPWRGLSYAEHVEGIAQGIEDARAETGIEGRIIVSCVRHFGVDRALTVVREAVSHPHPLVTGFGMGGDEANFPPEQFAEVYRIAQEEAGWPARFMPANGPARNRSAAP